MLNNNDDWARIVNNANSVSRGVYTYFVCPKNESNVILEKAAEMERVREERNILSKEVTKMQLELKDQTKQIELLKKETKELKDIQKNIPSSKSTFLSSGVFTGASKEEVENILLISDLRISDFLSQKTKYSLIAADKTKFKDDCWWNSLLFKNLASCENPFVLIYAQREEKHFSTTISYLGTKELKNIDSYFIFPHTQAWKELVKE